MNRFHTSYWLLFLAVAIGCAENSPEPSTGQNERPPQFIEPALEPLVETSKSSATETTSETATQQPETKNDKEKDAPVEVAEKETTTPDPEPKPERDPILEGLTFEGLDEQFAALRDAYTKSPEDTAAVGQYLQIVEQLGFVQARQGNRPAANLAFARAGEILDKAVETGIEIEPSLKGVVYYNFACVKSLEGKAEEALALVEKAFENGFDNLSQLKEDTDLVAVRDLPGFADKFAAWEIAAKERQVEHARADLAGAESFPFTFELTDVKGAPIKLADFQGKVCIVDIWGTWCPPCREEIPSFIKLQETYGSQGFQMVGLNQENEPTPEEQVENVTAYMEKNGMNYPCALITEDVLNQVPDFGGFPTTLFIDRQGKVRLKAVGLHEYAYLDAVVSELLAEATTPAADSAPAEGAAPAASSPAEPAAPASEETTPPAGEETKETP